jgi:hypothetical protein
LDITGHTDVEPVFGSIETVDRDALAAYAVETRAVTR